MIFHLCEEKEWIKAKGEGNYRPLSLSKENFIHLSTYGQVLATANRLFKKTEKPIALAVDNNFLHHKELKWEGADGFEFPHIYRSLKPDEISAAVAMKKDESGNFIASPDLDKWAQAVKLDTNRLTLREFQMGDVHDVQEYAGDPENLTYMVWGPNNELETRQFFSKVFRWQAQNPRFEYHFAVVEKSSAKVIGACSVSVADADRSTAEMGYIIRKDRQGQGYATEFCQKLMEYSFLSLKVEKVAATCDERNMASLKVMQKIGLKKEMILENDVVNGRHRNTVVCSILKEKFYEN